MIRDGAILDKKIIENHKRYLERVSFYRKFGYDLEKEREFIFDKSLPISGKILEIGTGKGHFALVLAKHGLSFDSIDISKEEQEVAKLNIQCFGLKKQVIFRIEDAGHLSFPDQSFDTIFSVNVFHHLEKPLAVLNEIIRLLRPGGKVVLSDFSIKGFEIINRCHSYEGRKHDYAKNHLDEAIKYFINKEFNIKEFQSEVQRVIVIRHN